MRQRSLMRRVAAYVAMSLYCIAILLFLDFGYSSFIALGQSPRIPVERYHHGLKANFSGYDRFYEILYPFFTNSLGLRDGQCETSSRNPQRIAFCSWGRLIHRGSRNEIRGLICRNARRSRTKAGGSSNRVSKRRSRFVLACHILCENKILAGYRIEIRRGHIVFRHFGRC